MKTMKFFLVLGLFLLLGSMVQAQTSGNIYVRDANASGSYQLFVHVYDSWNSYAELPGSPTYYGTITINSTNPWSGGPALQQDCDQRWVVAIEIRKVDPPNPTISKWSIYPSLLSTTQYDSGGLTMPNVTFP